MDRHIQFKKKPCPSRQALGQAVLINQSKVSIGAHSPMKIHPDEIRDYFIRSSGPGGQNVNKVAPAVQLRFNVRASRSIEPDVQERLIRLAARHTPSDGIEGIGLRRA